MDRNRWTAILRTIVVIGSAGVIIALCTSVHVITQGMSLPGPVTHVGVVVKDIDRTVAEYVRVTGFPAPKINDNLRVPAGPDGQIVEARIATMYMPNFFIEVIQPKNNLGTYYEQLRERGQGIHHFGIHVPGDGPIDEARATLEERGGRWASGQQGSGFAYVSFGPTLGTVIELNRSATAASGAPAPAVPTGGALPPLAALKVTHVGFAAADAAKATSEIAKIFGASAPNVNDYKDSQ